MQDNPEKPLFDPDMVYPIPVPAFGISLRGVPLDGFQTGDQSWIIATPMRSPDAESIGKQFVLLITDDKGRNQHLSLRTFEKSTFGSVGFVTGEGDPAMRWISAFDPRIRRFWKAVGKYSQL